jgi:tetratricopeptide (TPR) repeat protein
MPKPRPSPLGVTLRCFRFAAGWSEEELARALGVKPVLISGYERGSKKLSRERLEELLAVMGVPSEAADASLYALELALPAESAGSPVDPTPAQLRCIHRAAAVAGQQAAEATRKTLTENVRRLHAGRARCQAGKLWEALQALSSSRRRQAIEREEKFWTWAVAERLCAESVRAAAHRADVAVELAGLALRVAELVPETETWRSRLQGYAWAFVANARRVQGDLPGAEEAFLRSDHLWEVGTPTDPAFLDGSRLFDLKASLRRHQGRYEESLALLDQALATSPPRAAGRILLMKGFTLEQKGDYEHAIQILRQAEPLIDRRQDPRLPWVLRLNLGVILCRLERYKETQALLPEVRDLAVGLGNNLDLRRVLWLEGRVLAGLGQREQALLLLEQVRRYFTANRIAFDAALASLEVAVLYLEQGWTAEVKRLAEEMLWIFKSQRVHQEALAALRLFCETAKKEKATVELTRRVAEYLGKARHNPKLRFVATGQQSIPPDIGPV